MISAIIGLILLVGGITLYRTFALYEEKKEFNVLRGRVPAFGNYDIDGIAITLDGTPINKIPERGAYTVSVECTSGDAYWDYTNWRASIGNFTKGTKCNVNFTTGNYFSNYLIAASNTDKTIVKYTHGATIQTESNATIDYRYSGKEVNNYICFKDNECSEDELYRIIGVIPTQSSVDGEYENRVKVIKATNYEGTNYIESNSTYTTSGKGYRWNQNNTSNIWYNSTLHSVLNTEYYSSLGNITNYIDKAKWHLGAASISSQNTYSAENYYALERSNTIGKSGGNLIVIDYIGLMYPSDYGYAVASDEVVDIYHKPMQNNKGEYGNNSWIRNPQAQFEWTITPESSLESINAWSVVNYGEIYGYTIVNYPAHLMGVRPVFYLNASVQYKNGSGTKEEPYQISLN